MNKHTSKPQRDRQRHLSQSIPESSLASRTLDQKTSGDILVTASWLELSDALLDAIGLEESSAVHQTSKAGVPCMPYQSKEMEFRMPILTHSDMNESLTPFALSSSCTVLVKASYHQTG